MRKELMTDDEIIKKFKLFTHPEEGKAISHIAISEGLIYSTDGRMAFVGKLNDPHADEVPEKYPIKSMQGILDGPRAITRWFAIKFSEFEVLDESFKKTFRSELAEHNRAYLDRYTEGICPCCNETVYWDFWNDMLVKEKEKMSGFDLREVEKSTRVIFGNSESVLIKFGYLHQVMHAFGESIQFAIGHCTDEKNPMLYMRTADDLFYGVLMPLRSYDDAYESDYTLHAESVV